MCKTFGGCTRHRKVVKDYIRCVIVFLKKNK
jgi:hypothetical protein